MTRDEWTSVENVLHEPDVKMAMRGRCEEQGHEWDDCCSPAFQIYRACKWCGATK